MAKKQPKKGKKLLNKLKNRYRLVVMNDATFDERFSVSLTPLNVISGLTFITIILTVFVLSIIVFTPAREYIPGYGDTRTRMNAMKAAMKADSLQAVQRAYEQYYDNVKRVLSGEISPDSVDLDLSKDPEEYENLDFSVSKEDSILRNDIESRERYALSDENKNASDLIGMPKVLFFVPMRGTVTSQFDAAIKHFGVDITAPEGEAVMAVYDGTVIFSSFTSDGGNVIQIQHPNNLISVYKHNSVVLKKVGDRVRAGENIAIIGNSGEYTDGPHLHFELWHNGVPIDPQEYIAFSADS
jgi:murein DD-endopeptidase MepM/ murein hydrolase activator NlpD